MDLHARSIELIRDAQHRSGAWPAALGYPTYAFSWVRDGSFIAHAADQVGAYDSSRAFHRWVAGVVERHRHKIEALEEGLPPTLDSRITLHTRFTLKGEENVGPWENFQLDGYGFWLTALAEHLLLTGDHPGAYREAVELLVRYLSALWDRPCYDCWEEHREERHPTTMAAIAEGLRRASALLGTDEPAVLGERIRAFVLEYGTTDGALAKFVGSAKRDASSLFAVGPFGPFEGDEAVVKETVQAVEGNLVADEGGVYRYLEDTFYGGGLWVPLAGALAWLWVRLGDPDRARSILGWIEGTADESDNLPEQLSYRLLHPDRYQEWVDRWGPVARPLLWSHAMYLIARESLR